MFTLKEYCFISCA